jgi:hypothetical protein
VSEDELLQLLQVPLDKWSPFYLATRRTLCKTGGLINISCNVMSQAVRQRYLETPVARTLVHQQLLLFTRARVSGARSKLVLVRS